MTTRSPVKGKGQGGLDDERTKKNDRGERGETVVDQGERELIESLKEKETVKGQEGNQRAGRSLSLTDDVVPGESNVNLKPGRLTNFQRTQRLKGAGSSEMMEKFALKDKLGEKDFNKNKDKQELDRKREIKAKKEVKELGDLEELIKRMGENTNICMEKINKNLDRKLDSVSEGLSSEIGKVKKMCEEWERKWSEEKEKMYEKLEKLEKGQKDIEVEMEGELNMVKEEVRESREIIGELRKRITSLETGTEGGIRSQEGLVLEEKMNEVSRWMDRTEKEKRKNNIVIKGMNVIRREGRKAIQKVLEDIGTDVKIIGLNGVGGEDKEKPKVWIVQLENEEQKMEVISAKNKLRGRKEIIEEDKTWKERVVSRKLDQRKWEESAKGSEVKRGRDCLWVNGIKWVVCNTTGEVVEEERGRERNTSQERNRRNRGQVFRREGGGQLGKITESRNKSWVLERRGH
ncbi:golgin subfamily A member 6-like protein 22 [Leptopilina heterotoma]|uniref:golgin subfamily A member 6-like protein 22 n=1 Tax=Leptopilina heterotoma TaxID=63436 RepID=UPI001CA7C4E1|nr:golgin subfamily A member 6-like protein 22 [Leptopilina heterotoma]